MNAVTIINNHLETNPVCGIVQGVTVNYNLFEST